MSSQFFVRLKARGAVRVSGPDAGIFLQGLITNDIQLLDTQPMLYACLLTPQGKFMFDFFLTRQGDAIQLECEGGDRALALRDRLNHFRLRSKVTLESIENIDVFQIIGKSADAETFPDPRLPVLGFRSYSQPEDIAEESFDVWDRHRILHIIPDGSRDMKIETSTLAEARADELHGVSYTKGCYMGQELTARIHHRGLAKRHLVAIRSESSFPPAGAELRAGEALLGEMRSSCGDLGLALIKDETLPLLETAGYYQCDEFAIKPLQGAGDSLKQ